MPSDAAPLTRRRLRQLAAAQAAGAAPADAADLIAEPFVAPAETASVEESTRVAGQGGVSGDGVDAFAAAALALRFTGPNAVLPQAVPVPEPAAEQAAEQAHIELPVAKRRRSLIRGITTAAASIGAMGAVGLLAVGMTTPLGAALADGASSETATTSIAVTDEDSSLDDDEIQAFVTSSDVTNAEVERADGYSSESLFQYGSAAGINTSGAFFENDVSADIQWPFAVGTSMSSGYGMRWGRLHEGIDFTPGDGAQVQAVADGVVRTATEAGGAYGVNVYIDHMIDGKLVTSHYAHMQYGSLQVKDGDTVSVGQVIGLTGNTGRSYGAHTHFEIIIDGSTIDPLPWLETNANRHYTDEEAQEAEAGLAELQASEGSAE